MHAPVRAGDRRACGRSGCRLRQIDGERATREETALKYTTLGHTDITIPYDELDRITAIRADGSEIPIIAGGRFVHVGTPHHYHEAKPGETEEAFATRLAEELEARKVGWAPIPARFTHGVLGKYQKLVGSASKGAVLG